MKIQINNIVKSYAGEIILNGVGMEIIKGSKSAVVGENGSGKTTLLKVLSGIEQFQDGSMIIPREMTVGYMMQVYPDFNESARNFILSVFPEYIEYSIKLKKLEHAMSESKDLETLLDNYTKILSRFEASGGYGFENTLDSYAKGLGIYDILEQPFNTLSGGQKTRAALVQLLLQDYEVLCLDEPTNHLDSQGIEWLEQFCQSTPKTLIIVSHDRQFLMNTVSVFHEIEDGNIVTYHGDYDAYRTQRHDRYLKLVVDFEQQQKEISKIQIAIRRYRQWGHESNNEDFYKRAKALEKRLDRIEKLPKPIEIRNQLKLNFRSVQKSSKEVIIAHKLVIGYDKPLTQPLTFTINRKDRIAFVAPNGKGKTTLLKTLLQEIKPLSGTIRFGDTVDIGYLPQIITFNDTKERILPYFMRSCILGEETARRYLSRFGFYQQDMYKTLSSLSGGEQVRLKLLELMDRQVSCIILDEPTNHLDIESCEIVERVLSDFNGTLIVISHDRMFLNKLKVNTLSFD